MLDQLETLQKDPQIQQWMEWLTTGLMLAVLLALIADFALLFRWVKYRLRVADERAAQTEGEPPAPLPPSPLGRPWSPVHVFIGGQAILLLLLVVTAIPLIPAMMLAISRSGPLGFSTDPIFQQTQAWIVILSPYAQNALTIAVVVYFLRRYGQTLQDIGLKPPTRRQIGLGLLLGGAIMALAFVAEKAFIALLQSLLDPATMKKLLQFSSALAADGMFKELTSPVAKLVFLIGGAVAAPLGEEIFFRGFLYNSLRRRYSLQAALILSSLIFAVIHFSPLAVLVIVPMGYFLAYVYEKTGSLWVPIIIHMVNNTVAFVAVWVSAS